MVSAASRDPALVDRRSRSLPAVRESELPSRVMTIPGCEGRIEARTLSKDMSGPATRLVMLSRGWGSGVAGAFTADVELFVIRGDLMVAGRRVGQYDYAAVRSGEVVSGVRALSPTLALLMTSAPVRYDTSAGGMLSKPLIGSADGSPWAPVSELPGRFIRPLADGPHGHVWLAGGRAWTNEDGPWHSHPGAEEVFVLDGEFTVTERPSGHDPDGSGEGARDQIHRWEAGTYTYRLPGQLHAGPGSGSSELALAFHRTHGHRTIRWERPDRMEE